ncbi:hypothetical protein VBD025_11320 [Virgibacillus flavescens]|uniref:hypothetical protein n=1 Tax=Virgibacillus flavescens TaxID=1611422 RepID=UPI003D334CFC
MSDKHTKQDDQAAELRKLFNEVQGNSMNDLEDEEKQEAETENELNETFETARKIDTLDLPPRKEVHSQRKKRTRLKMSKPLLRFSAFILILILVIFAVFYVWGDELLQLPLNL